MNWKKFLLQPSFIVVIHFPSPCGGGSGWMNLVMVVWWLQWWWDYRNMVRWWRKNAWNGGVGGFGERIKKIIRRREITELCLGLERATISIKFVDLSQRKTARPISLYLQLATLIKERLSSTRGYVVRK